MNKLRRFNTSRLNVLRWSQTEEEEYWLDRLSRAEELPETYNRARYVREACKVFVDPWKAEAEQVIARSDWFCSSTAPAVLCLVESKRWSRMGENLERLQIERLQPRIFDTGQNGQTVRTDSEEHHRSDDRCARFHRSTTTHWDRRMSKSSGENERETSQSVERRLSPLSFSFQLAMRQTIHERREECERTQRKVEAAEAAYRKYLHASFSFASNAFLSLSLSLSRLI